MLACFGLRHSEICALALEDINGNIVTINKALVLNKNKDWVLKHTKTPEGTREIWIPDNLVWKTILFTNLGITMPLLPMQKVFHQSILCTLVVGNQNLF